MLQRLRRPKAARTKTTRKDSRRERIGFYLISVVDEELKRYLGSNGSHHQFAKRQPIFPILNLPAEANPGQGRVRYLIKGISIYSLRKGG